MSPRKRSDWLSWLVIWLIAGLVVLLGILAFGAKYMPEPRRETVPIETSLEPVPDPVGLEGRGWSAVADLEGSKVL